MADHKQPLPEGYIKAVQHGFLGPASWVNVFYFAVTAGSHTVAEIQAAAAAAVSNFYVDGFGLANFTANWTTTYVTVTYAGPSGMTYKARVADAHVGTSAGLGQDAQVAFLINWGTGDARKGGKPRQYVPGVPDHFMADSAFLTSDIVGSVSTDVTGWLAIIAGGTPPLELVEMSFRDANTWRDTPLAYPVVNGFLNPVVATQRRRVDRLRPS